MRRSFSALRAVSLWSALMILVLAAAASGQCPENCCPLGEELELINHDPGAYSVGVEGDWAVVGSLWDNEAASRAGAAFVYHREGGAWVFTQKLLASDAFRDDGFGWRPLIRGNWMFITALHRGFGRGAVYVFELQGVEWVEVQQLTMTGAFPAAFFGRGKDFGGGLLAISADGAARAWTYVHDGTAWVLDQELLPDRNIDGFGRRVAVGESGNYALVSSSLESSVIAFQKSGSTFQQIQELTSPLGTPGNHFGHAIDEDGGVMVVGAPDESGVESNAGKAYVYRFDGIQTWNLEATLEAQLEKKERRFGYDVAIDGDSIVVGAPSWASASMRPGQAFLFRHDGQSWHRVHQLKPGDGISGDYYGIYVALSGDLAWCVADDGVARAYAFDLREQLVLSASPTTVMAGDTLALDTCGGTDGHLVALFAVDIGGTPLFWHLLTGSFLGTTWDLSVFLPDPLGPVDVTFRSLGIGLNGNLVMSSDATVTFQ